MAGTHDQLRLPLLEGGVRRGAEGGGGNRGGGPPAPMVVAPPPRADADKVTKAYVVFFKLESAHRNDADLINRLLHRGFRWLNPGYEHCQFAFGDGHVLSHNGEMVLQKITFSTTKRHPFAVRDINYANENWVAFEILNLPVSSCRLLASWCSEHEAAPFNSAGFYWNFLPCVPAACAVSGHGQSFFCAEMVVMGMQLVDQSLLPDVQGHLCKTDDLFDIVSHDYMRFRRTSLGPMSIRTLRFDSQ